MPTFPKKSGASCYANGGGIGGQFSFGKEDEVASEEEEYAGRNNVQPVAASAAQSARNTADELGMGGKMEAEQATAAARKELLPKAKKKGMSAFETAFAAARKAGEKTFEFKGKSYTTKVK